MEQGGAGTLEEGRVAEEVGTGVAGEGEFGEDQQLHALGVGLPDEVDMLFEVIFDVSHPNGGDGRGDTEVAVVVVLLIHSEVKKLFKNRCQGKNYILLTKTPNRLPF